MKYIKLFEQFINEFLSSKAGVGSDGKFVPFGPKTKKFNSMNSSLEWWSADDEDNYSRGFLTKLDKAMSKLGLDYDDNYFLGICWEATANLNTLLSDADKSGLDYEVLHNKPTAESAILFDFRK